MIETTMDEVDGVRFYKKVRVLETDAIINGVPVHRLEYHYLDKELVKALKMLGLRKVGFDFPYRAELWVSYPVSYWRFRLNGLGLRIYWVTIRWLYDNARIFKQIPLGAMFSWSYFTPYVWYREWKGKKK